MGTSDDKGRNGVTFSPLPPLMGMFSVTWVSTVYLGARKQFLNFAEACSAPSTTSPVTSSSHFCGGDGMWQEVLRGGLVQGSQGY